MWPKHGEVSRGPGDVRTRRLAGARDWPRGVEHLLHRARHEGTVMSKTAWCVLPRGAPSSAQRCEPSGEAEARDPHPRWLSSGASCFGHRYVVYIG